MSSPTPARDDPALRRTGLLPLLLLALVGCTTPLPAPDPAQQPVLPAAWSGPAAAGEARAGPAADWWRGLGDDTLAGLVEAALAANADLAVAQANLRRARALRSAASAALQPTLQFGASAQRSERSGGAASLFDAGFDAAWEPDLFGGRAHAEAAAAADARAVALDLAAARVSLAAEVVAAYAQLRGTQVRQRIARENLVLQQQALEIAGWRQRAGLVSALDVEQARAAVEQTRAQLPLLQVAAAQTVHALAVLAGHAPSAVSGPAPSALSAPAPSALHATLADEAALPQPPRGVDAGIPAALLRRRADLQAAEAELQAAAARVAEADAGRRPTIALRASLAWSALTLSTLGSGGAAAALLASASQPLFDGGQRDARLDAQRAAFEAAQARYRSRVLVALREVEDALAALRGGEARLVALRGAQAAAVEAARLAEARYAGGTADFLVLLDSQRTRLAQQDSLAQAETDQLSAHLRLVKALGGGWRDDTGPP